MSESGPVEVHYFFNPVSAPSVHLATQWVVDTIENGYRSMLNSNELVFIIHRVDDPLEADAIKQYRAGAPSLFIVSDEKGDRKAVEVKALWACLDDSLVDGAKKTKFIELLKDRLDSALGLSSYATTTAKLLIGNDKLYSLDFRISSASTPELLIILLFPYDAAGEPLVIDAGFTLKMWDKPAVFLDDRGDLLQVWQDIPVNEGNFVKGFGLVVSLPYQNFQPAPGSFAYLQMTLTVDGTVFNTEKALMVRPRLC